MACCAATTRTPQIEEIKSLYFHQPNVDEEVITSHEGKGNEEPNNGFWSDKLFLFVSRKIVHICLNSHKKINDWFSLSNRLPPNGCKPIEEPQRENNGPDINQGSCLFLNLFYIHCLLRKIIIILYSKISLFLTVFKTE